MTSNKLHSGLFSTLAVYCTKCDWEGRDSDLSTSYESSNTDEEHAEVHGVGKCPECGSEEWAYNNQE